MSVYMCKKILGEKLHSKLNTRRKTHSDCEDEGGVGSEDSHCLLVQNGDKTVAVDPQDLVP